jgi:hypothetical protein
MYLARSTPTNHTISSYEASRHIGSDICEVNQGGNQDRGDAGDMRLTHPSPVTTITSLGEEMRPTLTRQPNPSSEIYSAQWGDFPTSVTQGESGCYAQKQSADRRESGQRETPRVGPQNRVWGLEKPESSSCRSFRLVSGGLSPMHTLRGCACPVKKPGGVVIPQGRAGARS